MKSNTKTLVVLTLVSVLGAGVAVASGKTNAYNLPDEVKSSSVQIKQGTPEDPASLMKLAGVSQQQAEAAALKVQPGQVLKAKLDNEDGYLVWQIDIQHGKRATEFAVDAGNGKVVAAEAEKNDDHDSEKRNERS